MIDPITAFAAAQTAVSAIKKGIQLGKDIGGISGDLAKFAGAISDIDFAHKSAENQPWYAVLFGGSGPSAMDIFAKKKQAEALRAEIKQYIQFGYGQSAWEELLRIEAQVRKERQKTLYRKAEIKQTIIEWIVGILVLVSGIGILGMVLYFIGKKQGKW
ncbi:hypothetical protein OAI16_06770 [Flavobacteriaceae bacterium]|nr:hypothetical protein [Flavobacteriaceae bacterium]